MSESLSASCRVLTVAEDVELARRIIKSIASIRFEENSIVPWTISNKYYTADIHFKVEKLLDVQNPKEEDEKVPAVLFIFVRDQDYRSSFLQYQSSLSAHDAEVCMAVALPAVKPVARRLDEDDDDEALEDFFSERGFEFISADENLSDAESSAPNASRQYDGQGVPRIREALHSIVWPSLIRNTSSAGKSNTRRDIPMRLANDIDTGETLQLSVDDLTDDVALSLFTTPDGAVDDRDLEALEAWLDADPSAAWHPSTDPNSIPKEGTQNSGFDDDFSEFVSATPPSPLSLSELRPLETGPGSSYSDPIRTDEWLPSQSEIAAASARLFGPSSSSPPPPPAADDGEGGEAFDLSLVLSTLQAMKEEISSISDENLRRKAAAKAALGLVAGLNLDHGIADDGDDDGSELGELLAVV